MKRLLLAACAAAVLAPAAQAAVKPHALICDNMVLQQGVRVPLWGTADDGEKVTVRFNGQEVSTTARDGKWLVHLEPLKPGGPQALTISGSSEVQIKNVLVGEVWIASGQSNMEWPVDASENPQAVKNAAKNPTIRFFRVPHTVVEKPLSDTKGQWVEADPKTVGSFSAVGYFFARELNQALGVPVGVIQSAWGGTVAEAWTARAALEADPALKGLVPAAIQPGNPNQGTALYNGMIAPLQPYAFKGVIWYQGESNAFQRQAVPHPLPGTHQELARGVEEPRHAVPVRAARSVHGDQAGARGEQLGRAVRGAAVDQPHGAEDGDGRHHRPGQPDRHPPPAEGPRRRSPGAGGPRGRLRREDRLHRPGLRQDDRRGEQGGDLVPQRRQGAR
jgi:hypothetical protein